MTNTNTIDKHRFKITVATAIIVIIFIIVTSVQTATWKTTIEAEHQMMQNELLRAFEEGKLNAEHIIALESRASERDIQLAKMDAKLTNIEAMVIEIRLDLKEQFNKE